MLGPKHPDTLISVHNLGSLLLVQGKLGEAEQLLREALSGRCSALGPAHPGTRSIFTRLLSLLTGQGKAREARELRAQYGGGSGR